MTCYCLESTRETDTRETWAKLTVHCPEEAPEVWVLWTLPIEPSAGYTAWRNWYQEQSKISPMDRRHDLNEFLVSRS